MPVWDPFREMEALRRDIDRAFSRFEPGRGPVRGAFLPGSAAQVYPLINLSEDADHVYVHALAPGIDPQALNLSVLRNTLSIAGEKLGPKDVPAEAFHRSERATGRFFRTIELPTEVDGDRVEAKYADGVLSITLAKAEAAKPKQIQVAVS
jgi:HSP20 family protein